MTEYYCAVSEETFKAITGETQRWYADIHRRLQTGDILVLKLDANHIAKCVVTHVDSFAGCGWLNRLVYIHSIQLESFTSIEPPVKPPVKPSAPAESQITCKVDPKLVQLGREVRERRVQDWGRQSPRKLTALALMHLSLENAEFSPMDKEKDTEIKKNIKLWLESWVIPPLEEACEKLERQERRR